MHAQVDVQASDLLGLVGKGSQLLFRSQMAKRPKGQLQPKQGRRLIHRGYDCALETSVSSSQWQIFCQFCTKENVLRRN